MTPPFRIDVPGPTRNRACVLAATLHDDCGEDVPSQLKVLLRYGGCGMYPAGGCHMGLPMTIPVREADAPEVMLK